MAVNKIKGVHRVSKKLSGGVVRAYHYAFRGGPMFWHSGMEFDASDKAYVFSYDDALRHQPAKPAFSGLSTKAVIDRFRNSIHFTKKSPRTQKDYKKYLDAFEAEFGDDPIALFEEKESTTEIRKWKNDNWSHSPKQYDYATTVVTLFLNWAKDEDASIAINHHQRVKKIYKANRADILWLPHELEAILAVADECEHRIVIAASKGGLTPQDIGILTMQHVQKTPMGRRLFFKRTKTGNPTAIPVTPALDALIDATPIAQQHLIVSKSGLPLKSHRASQIIRDLKTRANEAANEDETKFRVREDLRLYDMRGTAATELLRAGCSLNEIAVTMGWGLRHAANIIEKYAALVPEVTDEVLAKLAKAQKAASVEK